MMQSGPEGAGLGEGVDGECCGLGGWRLLLVFIGANDVLVRLGMAQVRGRDGPLGAGQEL